ncbi:MAG: S46 family peptidase [Bacteroidota bacterium]
MKILRIILIFVAVQTHAQQGGMWIPSLLEGMNESEMQQLGSKLTASDIYDVNNSSLKDAVGHFNGGCTTEVISSKGLILTNHHCGFGQIQYHSSVENDYLKEGFWAMKPSEELPNDNLYVEFIVRIEDVTTQSLAGITDDMTEAEKQSLIDKNNNALQKSAAKEEWQDTKVKAFFKGNQYFLFITERFEDIRLVGAPPTSIGKFGSDTDNWVYPRHTGDFSLFRIYADKDNRPAKYSENNIPYTPKHFLPVSLDGVEEGDFTLVFGFPGRTDEYLPAVALSHITKEFNPGNIAIRKAALKVIDQKMKDSDEVRIKYASKQARIANAWKKWFGENLGIEKSNAIQERLKFEATFNKALDEKSLTSKYGYILPEFEKLYKRYAPINIERRKFIEVFFVTNELMQMTLRAYQLVLQVEANPDNFDQARLSLVNRIKGIHKNYDLDVDRGVFDNVMPLYTDKINASIYNKSAFVKEESALKLLEGERKQVIKKIEADPAYIYAKPMIKAFYETMNPAFEKVAFEIAALQKQYMKALMEALPEARYFPDANSTLRVTYGQVRGYSPRDAVYYTPVSYLDGVIEKYVPGDYEFDVPQKLIELYESKDYGPYADTTGEVPVCFLGTNHTTGGNSGSPAIDANGNLIGLNFDRVWEGTMSDMNYDPEICRNIMVDLRYVLFIIDKYAGAKHLIDEMKLVHPKRVVETE